ncbi:UPF0764 protein C16orf89 homolog [Agrilus planipennis]|uniref:UPF0764 protein C16orf89 homolog n=1 Tax=Agrilus planipennis TaxID=224129 RepID=A0A1W4WFD2_AGRPL|nr:UPF0764 protein C16orf89 homolog [Agrilus planipennis]
MILYISIFFALQMPHTNQRDINNKVMQHRPMIEQILNSLENVLNYTNTNYRKLNADAVLGISIAKAHLAKIQIHSSIISLLKEKTDIILKKSAPKVLDEVDWSFRFLLKYLLVTETWEKNVIFTQNTVPLTKQQNSQNPNWKTVIEFSDNLLNKNRAEKQWNDCVYSLLTNYLFWNDCKINEHCEKNFLLNKSINNGYGILHRLLFIQITQSRKCPDKNKWNGKIVELCSTSFLEADQNSKYGFIDILDDLFLEQVLLCGQEGFTEFFNDRWIQHVLKIQKENGCFSSNQDSTNIVVHRKRRNSNQISIECTDHTTGLAAAVLSLILRYLLV